LQMHQDLQLSHRLVVDRTFEARPHRLFYDSRKYAGFRTKGPAAAAVPWSPPAELTRVAISYR
jgi:hypothetical protein